MGKAGAKAPRWEVAEDSGRMERGPTGPKPVSQGSRDKVPTGTAWPWGGSKSLTLHQQGAQCLSYHDDVSEPYPSTAVDGRRGWSPIP